MMNIPGHSLRSLSLLALFCGTALAQVAVEEAANEARRPVEMERSRQRFDAAYRAIRAGKFDVAAQRLAPSQNSTHPGDRFLLGFLYRYGLGVRPDLARARDHFAAAGRAGVPQAFRQLSDLAGAFGDATARARCLEQAALLGDTHAMWSYACSLREGRGVPRDEGDALAWAIIATERGHREAKARLRVFASEASRAGVAKDMKSRIPRIKAAMTECQKGGVTSLQLAIGEVVDAQVRRGEAAYQRRDYGAAMGLLEPLARGANAAALFYVARMHQAGRGVAKNPRLAVELYTRSARLGTSSAQDNLGLMYLRGEGVAKNPKSAAALFQLAATGGNTDGMLNWGFCLGTGTGVAIDDTAAYAWYLLASRRGDKTAARNIKAVMKKLSAAQREAGDRRATQLERKVKGHGFDPARLPAVPPVPAGSFLRRK